MFRHLLVPVDDSDLSVINVGQAVKLASSFDPPAKLTFFHASADYAASAEGSQARARMTDKLHRLPVLSEGSGLPVSEPSAAQYSERVLGQSRALLAKAGAAAAAAKLSAHVWEHMRQEEEALLTSTRLGCRPTIVRRRSASHVQYSSIWRSISARSMTLLTPPWGRRQPCQHVGLLARTAAVSERANLRVRLATPAAVTSQPACGRALRGDHLICR